MRSSLFVFLILICLVCCTGKNDKTVWTFVNRSSQNVYIFNVNTADKTDYLEIARGGSLDVSVGGETLDYDYGPADKLISVRGKTDNTITFRDRTEDSDQ